MNKKQLISLAGLALGVTLLTTPTFADTNTAAGWGASEDGKTDVTVTVAPNYTITIPASFSFTAANVNTVQNEKVSISKDSQLNENGSLAVSMTSTLAATKTYHSRGDAAFYEDELYHLQMMDNRSTDGASWHISVQLKDKITSASGAHKVEGAMLWMPKGEARNELNQDSAAVDTTNFETFDGYITDTTPLEIWRTKGKADTRGKAISSYSWAANGMELHIPDYTDFLNESYSFSVIWTAAISPEM